MTLVDDKQARFLRRVEDAAAQYWLMRRWDDDQLEAREGWRRCYAVDADVVNMYTSPALMAQRRHNRWGYSEVFHEDLSDHSMALGRRLADFLFFDLQPGGSPLIIVPPIDGEVISFVNALAARLGDEPPEPQVDFDALARWEAKFKAIWPVDNSEVVKELLRELARVFNAGLKGEFDQFFRIAHLLKEQRIAPAHLVGAQHLLDPAVSDVLSAHLQLQDLYDLSKYGDVWRDALNPRQLGSDSRQLALSRDAEALARLELWNAKLKQARWRIVYVTGARHVIEAVEARRSAGNDSGVEVRHPRYFLASPKVVAVESAGPPDEGRGRSQFYDLIRTFLADCQVEQGDHMHLAEASREAATAAYRENPRISGEFENKWNSYLSELVADRSEHTRFMDRFREVTERESGAATQFLNSAFQFQDQARVLLEKMLDEAWEACFRAAVGAGFLIGRKIHRPPSRLVPTIVFDRWPATRAFVDRMADPAASWADGAGYEWELEKIRGETRDEAYPYAYYLAHAALFAGRGDWKVGAILARRALGKATPSDRAGKSNLAHGREAAYLAAYCVRHAYRSNEELDDADKLLDQAKTIYAAERDAEPGLEAVPERFEAEGLALEMTRLMHRRFVDMKEVNREAVQDLRGQIVALVARLDRCSSDATSRVHERVQVRLAANTVMLSALAQDYDTAFDAAGALLGGAAKDSRYLEAIALFYGAIRNPKMPMAQIMRILGDKSLWVLRYDELRFKYLVSEILRLREGA